MFSIITPSYNREDTLHRVYDSLLAQTYKGFHWVIVDDCSSDNTEQLVNGWIDKEGAFKIEYHKLSENKGKPNALNYGFEFCTEPLTVIADSDDSFEANTLEDLKEVWDSLDKDPDGSKVATVWTLTKDENGEIVGDSFPQDFWRVNFQERVLNRSKVVSGEKWHSWRTPILKEFGMFHNDNTKYIGESATWERINKKYDFLCLNKVHRLYWHSEDGIMQSKKSTLKSAKIKYYTAYYQLNSNSLGRIFRYGYYRNLAFEYIKASFKYVDKKNKIGGIKLLGCYLIFLFQLPFRAINKLK